MKAISLLLYNYYQILHFSKQKIYQQTLYVIIGNLNIIAMMRNKQIPISNKQGAKKVRTKMSSRQKLYKDESKVLDCEYLHVRQDICNTNFYIQTNQHNKIKFTRWFQKLDIDIRELPWKKNRNIYIKLLYLMSQCGVIQQPFSNLPPEGDIPQLKNYQINSVIDGVERYVNEENAKYGTCNLCVQQKSKCGQTSKNMQSTKMSCAQIKQEKCGEKEHQNHCNISQSNIKYHHLYQQLQPDLSKDCAQKILKSEDFFDHQQNKQNSANINTVLTNHPPKSKYSKMNKNHPRLSNQTIKNQQKSSYLLQDQQFYSKLNSQKSKDNDRSNLNNTCQISSFLQIGGNQIKAIKRSQNNTEFIRKNKQCCNFQFQQIKQNVRIGIIKRCNYFVDKQHNNKSKSLALKKTQQNQQLQKRQLIYKEFVQQNKYKDGSIYRQLSRSSESKQDKLAEQQSSLRNFDFS